MSFRGRKMYDNEGEESVFYDQKEEKYALLGHHSDKKTKLNSKGFLYMVFSLLFIVFMTFFQVNLTTTGTHHHLRPVSSSSVLTLYSQQEDKTHEYIRPKDVSGFPNNTAPNHRGPCPGLNTLANHGYLPRNGKDLSPQILKQAIIQVYNVDESLAQKLTESLPTNFTLADLSVHNMIEHDASLVHDDFQAFGKDPSFVNVTLANQLFTMADQVITRTCIAHFRRKREKESQETNGNYTFGLKQQGIAYGEAAILLIGMGDYDTTSISIENAKSFLVEEKIPTNWTRSKTPITTTKAFLVAAEIKALSFW